MKIKISHHDLRTIHPFGISRRTDQVFRNIIVEISHQGHVGIGEAAPSEYYGESRETVLGVLPILETVMKADPFQIEETAGRFSMAIGRNPAAKACLEMALYDLAGKMLNAPLYKLLGLSPYMTPVTSYTISLGNPDLIEAKLKDAAPFSVLKVKVGGPRDLETLGRIRANTDKRIRVDANGAWSPKEAVKRIRELCQFGIEFVEQPVQASDIDGLRYVRERVDIPIFADESAVSPEDVVKLSGVVDGINLKLMKSGGICQTLKMIHVARAQSMKLMIGCMIESSVGITAAAHLTPLVDYADLDGNLLIDNDPFQGVKTEKGKLILPGKPGLGLEPAH
ncbi:dipeptide epimerase [Acidobacteriota bacterium]